MLHSNWFPLLFLRMLNKPLTSRMSAGGAWYQSLAFLVLLLVANAVNYFPPEEYYGLLDLYNCTNGEDWYWFSPYDVAGYPWTFKGANNTNPCLEVWQGITCTKGNCSVEVCRVQSLNLHSHLLQGCLPPSLGSFPALQFIDLSQNLISGTIDENRPSPFIL